MEVAQQESEARAENSLINLGRLKDEIEKLPPAEREACDELYSHLKWQVRVAGDKVGPLALMLAAEEVKADYVKPKPPH